MRKGSRLQSADAIQAPKHVRCAIYTRKSTEEGLAQEFNSLDAQREAAESFIASQKHEGWVLVPDRYDDGGFTGSNLERPAMRRLLADVEASAVDCVVVYKVDRLSRSLADFARLMESFDKHSVSFVSVTQQFNTTTSLGRLTLNILQSFAQFEREIIAERTRDKMSAARRKGKWIGGHPVLGYDIDPRGGRLVVNQEEARRVRAMYRLYLQHRTLIPTVRAINARHWTTKQWTTKGSREHAGKPMDKNTLYRLLTNPLYVGKVNHKGQIFDGEHEAIIETRTWNRVDDLLRGANGACADKRNKHGALLRGLLQCEPCGVNMLHTYTRRGGRLYRYYVCGTKVRRGADACPGARLAANDIEGAVVTRIRELGKDRRVVTETIRKIREQTQTQREELRGDLRAAQKEIHGINRQLVRLAGSRDVDRIDRLADLQDRLRVAEQRVAELDGELAAIEGDPVEEREAVEALAEFDEIWAALNYAEQTRLLNLLIEGVGFNGATSKVSLTFRAAGFKALCGATGTEVRR